MKLSDLLAPVSCVSGALVFATTMITHSNGDRVPFVVGVGMAALIGGMIAGVYLFVAAKTTPDEGRRSRNGAPRIGAAFVSLGFFLGLFPSTALLTVWSRQWVLLLPLSMAVIGAVLAVVALHHEREVTEPVVLSPMAEPVGLPVDAWLSNGWIPVYVHRPGGRYRDMLIDYQVHVDGAWAGDVAPGQTLLIGLTPGPHTIQGRLTGGSSPVLGLWPSEWEPVHLTLEANGSDLEALTQMFVPNGYLRLVHRAHPYVAPDAGAQGPYP